MTTNAPATEPVTTSTQRPPSTRTPLPCYRNPVDDQPGVLGWAGGTGTRVNCPRVPAPMEGCALLGAKYRNVKGA